jgi:hypothetical protein
MNNSTQLIALRRFLIAYGIVSIVLFGCCLSRTRFEVDSATPQSLESSRNRATIDPQ